MRKIFLPPELYLGIEKMDNETKGILFDTIYRYNLGMEFSIDSKLEMIFGFFKPFFDQDIQRHSRFIESKVENGKLGGRPKASFIEDNNNPSNKPKKATKAKKPTGSEVKGSEYTRDIIYSYIDIDKYRNEFKNKNIEIEFQKMWNFMEGEGRIIKKPNQTFKNWLMPKKRDKEYIEGISEKTDEQRITEFLSGKNKFNEKYGWEKYQETKDLWIKRCIAQPLSL